MRPLRLSSSRRQRLQHPTLWQELGRGSGALLSELTSLYWEGVERDLREILRALQAWGQVRYDAVVPPAPSPRSEDWLGFESFVRRATKQDPMEIVDDIVHNIDAVNGNGQYEGIERLTQMLLEAAGFLDIDKIVEYRPPEYDIGVWLHPRAAQLAGPGQDEATEPSFESLPCSHCSEAIRGARFQCTQGCGAVNDQVPSVQPRSPPYPQRQVVLCETCARNQVHPNSHLRKLHKNCILAEATPGELASQICACWRSPNAQLEESRLYPFRKKDRGSHNPNCVLLQLPSRHCKARYDELMKLKQLHEIGGDLRDNHSSSTTVGASGSGPENRRKSLQRSSTTPVTSTNDNSSASLSSNNSSFSKRFGSVRKSIFRSLSVMSRPRSALLEASPAKTLTFSLPQPRHSLPTADLTSDARVTKSLKMKALRPAAQIAVKDIPFGNVHMGLMIGPLIIENGIPDSKKGALITVRDRLRLHPVRSLNSAIHTNLALGQDRRLWKASRIPRQRRIKAFMKQVVGGVFCGFSNESLDGEIIRELAQQSISCVYQPMKSEAYNQEKVRNALQGVLKNLRRLLGRRLNVYLMSVVNRLLDPEVHLRWHFMKNHCQKFCETLIDRRLFGSFLADTRRCHQHGSKEPLFLVSFVCRFGSHDGFPKKVKPASEMASPNGLTEEYLLRYRQYGHHNDSDIVDTLTGYWTDWAAFPGPIFPHQDLFPWDCTEARNKKDETAEAEKCGSCQLARHLWAFPFDSWSIVQFHLYRDRRFYTSNGSDTAVLSDSEWAGNRFRVLQALQTLSRVAVAMTKSSAFRENCRWAFKSPAISFPHVQIRNPRTRRTNSAYTSGRPKGKRITKTLPTKTEAYSFTDRVKLAGILRAQPAANVFEHGQFHDCTLAV